MSILIKEKNLVLKCNNFNDEWTVVGEVYYDENNKECIKWFTEKSENKSLNVENSEEINVV